MLGEIVTCTPACDRGRYVAWRVLFLGITHIQHAVFPHVHRDCSLTLYTVCFHLWSQGTLGSKLSSLYLCETDRFEHLFWFFVFVLFCLCSTVCLSVSLDMAYCSIAYDAVHDVICRLCHGIFTFSMSKFLRFKCESNFSCGLKKSTILPVPIFKKFTNTQQHHVQVSYA